MLDTPGFRRTNRSAFVNFLRAKYEAYTGATRVRSYPYYLCVDPCDICQLRCPTCPTGIEGASRVAHDAAPIVFRRQRAIMATDLFDALLEELGEYLFLIMFYNYGEPLLNKQLPSMIAKASARDIETEVHSNLSLPLSDAFIDELMGSGLDSLNASVDGFTQEAYQRHRVGGDVELVKRNLERLVAARARLGTHTQITYKFLEFSFNEHEVAAARQWSRERGINFVHGDAMVRQQDWLPRRRRNEAPLYTRADIERMRADWAAAGQPDYWDDHEITSFWTPFRDAGADAPSFCGWHYGYSVITAGGPVAPCCAAAKERDDFGRVAPGDTSFAAVWNNERYQSARRAFAGGDRPASHVDTLCERCYFPKFVQQLYSMHDLRVLVQFFRAFRGSEPALEDAFRLLSRARYPAVVHSLIGRGKYTPLLQLAGNGDERAMRAFVNHFASTFAAPPDAAESHPLELST